MGGRFRRIQVSFCSHFRLSSVYSWFIIWSVSFPVLNVGQIFQMPQYLSPESGQTWWHSLGVPELVLVFGSQSWSESLIFFSGSTTSDSHILSPVIRTKALLFTLIRAFEFDLAVSAKDIGTKALNFQRPILLTDPNNSNQMPLLVRPIASNL